MRCGLQHDLTGVGGVGEGLLVAGHPGGEDDLAERRAARAVGATGVAGAVLEDEDGRVGVELGGHASDPVGVGVEVEVGVSERRDRVRDGAGRGILRPEVGVDDRAVVGAPFQAHEAAGLDDPVDRDGRLRDGDQAVGAPGTRGALR